MLVVTGLDYGGAETQVVELALRFKERGWSVGVVTLVPPSVYAPELAAAGVDLTSLDMRRGSPDPRAAFRLASLYESVRPDVVHSHMVHANILARLARLLTPVPCLISTTHNIEESGFSRYLGYRLTDPMTEFTTNVSPLGVKLYVDRRAVPASKIGYMRNGINLRRFGRDAAARLRVRDALGAGDNFIWFSAGRLTPQKDFPNLFEAISLLQSTSRLWLAGIGELRAELEARVSELGLGERVRFLGPRSDIADLMSAADGFVLGSSSEGLPMVLLEAAACNLPAVATDVGGVSEIVKPGTGLLVAPKDPASLANAMADLEALPAVTRTEMGRLARETALAAFDIAAVVQTWETLYSSAFKAAGGRRRRRSIRLDDGMVRAIIEG